jgi:hypothetical protein
MDMHQPKAAEIARSRHRDNGRAPTRRPDEGPVASPDDATDDADNGLAQPVRIRPPERYGDHARGWTWSGIIAVSVLAVLFVAGIAAIGWHLSTPPFSVQLRGYTVLDDRNVRVTFLVRTRNPDTIVNCVVRARDRASTEVGRTTRTSTPGQTEQLITATVRTSARANLGEVQACRVVR